MNTRFALGAVLAAIAFTTPAAAHDPSDVVTPHFEHQIPNIPGKTLTALIVDYPPADLQFRTAMQSRPSSSPTSCPERSNPR